MSVHAAPRGSSTGRPGALRRAAPWLGLAALLGLVVWRMYYLHGVNENFNAAFFAGAAVRSVQLGSLYALIALGYTMVYGIIRLINFAHGEVFMVGAFAAYFLFSATPFAWPVAVVVAAVVAYGFLRFLGFFRVLGRPVVLGAAAVWVKLIDRLAERRRLGEPRAIPDPGRHPLAVGRLQLGEDLARPRYPPIHERRYDVAQLQRRVKGAQVGELAPERPQRIGGQRVHTHRANHFLSGEQDVHGQAIPRRRGVQNQHVKALEAAQRTGEHPLGGNIAPVDFPPGPAQGPPPGQKPQAGARLQEGARRIRPAQHVGQAARWGHAEKLGALALTVAVHQGHVPPRPGQPMGQVDGYRRFPDPALAQGYSDPAHGPASCMVVCHAILPYCQTATIMADWRARVKRYLCAAMICSSSWR